MARQNIFIWSGHNYAVDVVKTLGIHESGGVARIGPVHYNSIDEIDEFLRALQPLLSP
jgi:selenocysteine lyase/cysteine desulfurase